MPVAGEISIERSKKKSALVIVGALVFVAAGLWMATSDVTLSRRFDDPLVISGIGWFCVVFFGACALSGLWRLFDGRPGLVLNEEGIYPFGKSSSSSRFVPWADISGFEVVSIKHTKLLVVKLFDLDKYLARLNPMTRLLYKMNESTCSGPIALTSSTLKIKFDDLVSLCIAYHDAYGSSTAGE